MTVVAAHAGIRVRASMAMPGPLNSSPRITETRLASEKNVAVEFTDSACWSRRWPDGRTP